VEARMSTAALNPSSETPALSEPERILDTFIAPSKTFADLRRSAAWWAPFLLLAIVSLGFVYVVDQKIGFAKVVDNQIQLSPKQAQRMDGLSPSDRQKQMDVQTKWTRNFSYGYPVVILIWNLMIAAILFATFKFGASAQTKFWTAYAIVMYASLPFLIRSILSAISVGAGAAADSFTFQNPLASNPGYFLNPANGHFLYSVMSALDIFMIWTLFLTAIGFSVTGKVKRSTAMVIVFGWYVAFTLISAGLSAAFT
jgi:hypothetical protein